MTSTMPPMAPPPTMTPEPHGMAPKPRPTGVTILAVLAFVAAGFAVLAALAFFAGGALLGSMFGNNGAMAGAAIGAFVGFFFLVFAVVSGLTGYGMWNGKGWGWVLGLVWAGLGVLGGLSSLAQRNYSGVVSVLVEGFVIWYLLQPGVKAWFGRAA